MRLSRFSRRCAAVIALFSMLFMQLAVAAYACPQLGTVSARAQAQPHRQAGCAQADQEQPSLCHAHGQAGKQSLDKPELPPVQPFVAVGPAIPLATVDWFDDFAPPTATGASLTRTTAPPLSIRNCCFRI